MSEEQKTNLFNLQERANVILTEANAHHELICEWTRVTGRNRRQRVCISAYERERMRDESRDRFIRINPSHKNLGADGGG